MVTTKAIRVESITIIPCDALLRLLTQKWTTGRLNPEVSGQGSCSEICDTLSALVAALGLMSIWTESDLSSLCGGVLGSLALAMSRH